MSLNKNLIFYPLTILFLACASIGSLNKGFDSKFALGTLDNGVSYYLRENAAEKDRAVFALIVNAGSVLEEDDQRGLAHFVEHMMFNGTEKYPGTSIVDTFESYGVEFGRDLNAYTSFDETVFYVSIPTDKPGLIDETLIIINEIAHNLTYTEEAIDKERGVVIQEDARSQEPDARSSREAYLYSFKDSLYAERSPIGIPDVISTAPRKRIKAFYDKWYKPNMMAILAAGDFDREGVEEKMRSHITFQGDRVNRPAADLPIKPGRLEAQTFIVEGVKSPAVTINYRIPYRPEKNIEELRRSLIFSVALYIMNNRFSKITDTTPLEQGYIYRKSLSADVRRGIVSVVGIPDMGGEEATLRIIMEEIARLKNHPVTEEEIQLAVSAFNNMLERRGNDLRNGSILSSVVEHFINEEPLYNTEWLLENLTRIAKTLAPEEIRQVFSETLADNDRIITLVTAPSEEALTEEAILKIVAEEDAHANEIAAPVSAVLPKTLLKERPKRVKAILEEKIPEVNAVRLVFANGAEVFLKKTNFTPNNISFSGIGGGGSIAFGPEERINARYALGTVVKGGIGGYDEETVRDFMTTHSVGVSLNITDYGISFSGEAFTKKSEEMLKILYLYLTQPQWKKEKMEEYRREIRQSLERLNANPESMAFSQSIAMAYDDNPLKRVLQPEDAETIDFERAFAIYKEAILGARGKRMALVGDFNIQKMKKLVERYIGSLPAGDEPRSVKPLSYAPGGREKETFVGKGSGYVVIGYPSLYPQADPIRELRQTVVMSIFDTMLTKTIREELSLSYSVFSFASTNRDESPPYFTRSIPFIMADVSADKAHLIPIESEKLITTLKEGTFDDILLTNALLGLQENVENYQEENSSWSYELSRSSYFEETVTDTFSETLASLEEVTRKDIIATANTIFDPAKKIVLIQRPTASVEQG